MKATKWELFSLLAKPGEAEIDLPSFGKGILQSIEREDGSGASFTLTVKVYVKGGKSLPIPDTVEVYCRTTD